MGVFKDLQKDKSYTVKYVLYVITQLLKTDLYDNEKKKKTGTGEMAQELKALITLIEDPHLIINIKMVELSQLQFQEIQFSLLTSLDIKHIHATQTCIEAKHSYT